MFNSAPPIGLDLTPSSISAVATSRKGRLYSIDKVVVSPLPPGIIVDGEVQDVAALAAALRELWAREKFSSKTVNLGLANNRVITRIVDLPKIKNQRQLRDAIRFEAQDHLPIPLEDATWDYRILDEFVDESGLGVRQRVMIVMAYRESVEAFRDAAEDAGLKVHLADLSAFALMRAGSASLRALTVVEGIDPTTENVAFCDIGSTHTNVAVSRNGICEFTRLLPVGSRKFVETLAEQFAWSLEDAHRVTWEAGLEPAAGAATVDDPYVDTRNVLQFAAEQVASELRTTFDYFSHTGERQINRIVLSGEGSLLRGLDVRLANALGMPVSVLDATPLLHASSAPTIGAAHAHLAVALGLAMEDAA